MKIPKEILSLPFTDVRRQRGVPKSPGVYFVQEGNEIVYVGTSVNMYSRAKAQSYPNWKPGSLLRWLCLPDARAALEIEIEYIDKLQPQGNSLGIRTGKYEFYCTRCRAHWNRKDPLSTHTPIACPRCKNTRWNVPRKMEK